MAWIFIRAYLLFAIPTTQVGHLLETRPDWEDLHDAGP